MATSAVNRKIQKIDPPANSIERLAAGFDTRSAAHTLGGWDLGETCITWRAHLDKNPTQIAEEKDALSASMEEIQAKIAELESRLSRAIAAQDEIGLLAANGVEKIQKLKDEIISGRASLDDMINLEMRVKTARELAPTLRATTQDLQKEVTNANNQYAYLQRELKARMLVDAWLTLQAALAPACEALAQWFELTQDEAICLIARRDSITV